MMNRSHVHRSFVVILSLSVIMLAAGAALAHQSPAGCTANNLNVSFARSIAGAIRLSPGTGACAGQFQGAISYRVTEITNPAGSANDGCDISHTQVKVICPGATGAANGTVGIVSGNPPPGFDDFQIGGAGRNDYPFVDCTICVNPGVHTVTGVGAAGDTSNNPPSDLTFVVLHDAPDEDPFVVSKQLTNPVNYCGDSTVQTGLETCDPPGAPAGANGLTCRADCTVCGDGTVQTGEQCDD